MPMKWKNVVFIAGVVVISRLTPTSGQVRPQYLPAPTDGRVSVEGSVQDAATKRPIPGATVQAKNQAGAVQAQQFTDAGGRFQIALNAKQAYTLIIQASGYDPYDEPLTFTSDRVNTLTMRVPKVLYKTGTKPASQPTNSPATVAASATAPATPAVAPPASAGNEGVASVTRVTPPKTLDAKVMYTPPLVVAPVGKTTQLRAIQFVQSKAELLPDALPALEQLLAFMESKPTVEIELSGHTDNQGDFDENLRLSKQRVDVVKAYLVQNGIAASRITTRGYGPTRPIANNKSEATRPLNRRVEMIVVRQ